MTDRIELARQWYEDAVFGGDTAALDRADRELDGLEADLLLARGRLVHARFLAERKEDTRERDLFERAATLYQQRGDGRGEAEAVFWIGCYHQVVRGDTATALPHFERSRELATRHDDPLTLSYAVRHLGFAAMEAGDRQRARLLFEESVRLRSEIGFVPGVAAGMLALAELAAETGDTAEARRLAADAATLAQASAAAGIMRWIDQLRTMLN